MDTINEHPILFAFAFGLIASAITLFLTRSYWLMRIRGLQKELQLNTEHLERRSQENLSIDTELRQTRQSWTASQIELTEVRTIKERLEKEKDEMSDLHKELHDRFEVMANKILDAKSEKFTALNEKQIKGLIEPLGKDIEAFKQKVEQESKERFSLGERVKELVEMNDHMSTVAINLTKALKGESKTQGNWGEMILESILERSGLRKDEQYFMEYQLRDKNGKPLRSESEGKKMRPDAVIKYPDDRNVIVDSKVSLTAFSRAVDATAGKEYEAAIQEHLLSVKGHIDSLSSKGYDDYDRSLDFVLLFIPTEAAYMAALQADPELWDYAYDRRILLQSPTHLITSLKLIEELWKQESHNQNAQAIAQRGAKLYDKFVGFVENLDDVGTHLQRAQEKYTAGFKQLSKGPGNLIRQADQLKAMVGKTKKELKNGLVQQALED